MTTPLRRRIRHARRFFGYGLLVVLILAAVLVGALNQVLPLVEKHPEKIAAWLSERIGEPVAFDRARGEWTRRGPRFTLDGLSIGEGDRRLDVGRAELLVAVYSGLLPGEPLTELKVRDLALVLEQGDDRRWRLVGLPFEPKPGVDPLDTLEALGELQVERARLQVRSPSLRAPLEVPRFDLRLRVGGDHVLAGVRAWADTSGRPLDAVADLARGDWSGRLWAGGERLELGQWSRLIADTGLVMAGRGQVDLWARIESQRVMDVRTRAEFAPLALGARKPWLPDAGGRLASPPVAYERANLLARWQSDDNGWQLHAPELHFHETGRREPRSFDGLWLAGGDRFALQAPRMELAPAGRLASLSGRLPDGLRRWLHEAAPDGELRDVSVAGREDDWSGAARFDAVGWQPYGTQPGLEGLAGNAAFDQQGGVLRLRQVPVRLPWPARFREPFEVELDGSLGWWRNGDGWTLGAGGLQVRGPDFGTRLRGELALPGDGRPRLDLAADVDPSPVAAAGRFWVVGKMPPATIDWLDRALLDGQVLDGRAVFAGELADWPFRDGQGRFDARARVVGTRVKFNPDWPEAEELALELSFDGPGMALAGEGAIAGNRVTRVQGGIADFKDPRLRLDIESAASGESLQALMLASPLRARYEEHLRQASMRGPAQVRLALDLPLVARLGDRRIEGTLALESAGLSDPRWGVEFTGVSGLTRFSDAGFHTEGLQASFDGHPGVFDLAVGADTGDPALAARAQLRGRFPPAVLLARHEPLAWLRPHLQGEAGWDIAVEVPSAPEGAPAPVSWLRVESDLAGVAIGLPAPLDKAADVGLPLRLDAPLPITRGDLRLRLGELFQLRGRVGEDDALTGVIRLGEGGEFSLPAQGLVVRGRSERLDVAGWIGFAAAGGDEDEDEDEGGEAVAGLRDLDLQVARMDLLGSLFADTRLRLQRDAAGTRVQFEGPAIAGQVQVPADLARGVQGSFERLHWPEKPQAEDGEVAGTLPPPSREEPAATAGTALAAAPPVPDQDPTSLPGLKFTAEDLRVGALVLGRAELDAVPVPMGLRVERFATRSPSFELSASGDWRKTGEGSARSEFVVEFSASQLGELLGAFGLAGMVQDGPTRGRLEGHWPGSPGSFALSRFTGRFKADVGEGQLLDVEPGGGGRVLGLISLAEIPRRLTLDFSDFFDKGFGFNTMSGEFVFADGRASTDLLLINGPAAEIRVSGSTDLLRQEYDQRIEVLPKAGGVLPAIGAIAGGPVGAAVGAMAQAVLQQPLKQAARTVYHVTGPWKEPEVEVVERGARREQPAG